MRLCAQEGIPVATVPGPCALVTALALSGLPTQRFTFEGFLSNSGKSRREHLASLKEERRTIVLYEAPHKLIRTLEDLLEVLGDRDIALCRELTKFHEEARRTTIAQALEYYQRERPRGEFVLVIRGAPANRTPRMSLEEALEVLDRFRRDGLPLKEASRLAAARDGPQQKQLVPCRGGERPERLTRGGKADPVPVRQLTGTGSVLL